MDRPPAGPTLDLPHPGRRRRRRPGEALQLTLQVPRHPLYEDVAREGDHRYWVFALTGRARREMPVEVAAAGIDPAPATLIHDRIGGGERRPDLWLRIPPRTVLERLAEVRPLQLRVTGERLTMRLDFPANAAGASAARIVGDECGG